MQYGSTCICAFGKKFAEFDHLLRFRALYGTIRRVMLFQKIRDVRWHVVSVVFFSEFLWMK